MAPTISDLATWLGILGLFISQLGTFAKVSNSIAVNARRLDIMEEWQKTKSINRSELDAIQAANHAELMAMKDNMTSTFGEHNARTVVLERKLEDLSKAQTEIKMEVVKVPEILKRQEDIAVLRQQALEHSLAGLKMEVRAIARGITLPAGE